MSSKAALLALVAGAACASPGPGGRPASPTAPSEPGFLESDWGPLLLEAQVEPLMQRLSAEHQPETVAFEGVTVIPMTHDGADPDQTVVVEGGRIRSIGPASQTRVPAGARRVDGRGRWLMPGLTDMHVHTFLSSSDYLLDLANGVTTVREMDGFPWLLAMRAAARESRLLAPNLVVAGTLLSGMPMSWYATVVHTPEEARRIVAEQAAAGYDFIKVHNILAPEVFDAICAEAARRRIDVVGHVPHGITVAHAIACPMRTMEHFRGYLLDEGLTLSSEDTVGATRGAAVWNTPTFYNWRESARGDDARRLLGLPEMRYVPGRRLAAWRRIAGERPDALQQGVRPLEERIFRSLMPIHARMLAGTDSGSGYPFHVRGFSLHEELESIQALGFSPQETLRTATTEAALAMRRAGELGAIVTGARADVVLLSADPLATVANTAWPHVEGVMVRGIWLTREALQGMLDAVARIDDVPPDRRYAPSEIATALDALERLRAAGWPLRAHFLAGLRTRMEKSGLGVERPLFAGVASLRED
jgi:imidazolonepropionase-like amidohydrolase